MFGEERRRIKIFGGNGKNVSLRGGWLLKLLGNVIQISNGKESPLTSFKGFVLDSVKG